jgi:large subunit ribosomal protein L24
MMLKSLHVKKNDVVMVVTGKDKGKTGKILKVLRKKGAVIVEGVNMVKKHLRPTPRAKGGIVEREAPVHISNVMVYCDKCAKPVRVGRKFLEDGRKVRYCKKCKEVIDR